MAAVAQQPHPPMREPCLAIGVSFALSADHSAASDHLCLLVNAPEKTSSGVVHPLSGKCRSTKSKESISA
jgi:hypothetical protein